MSRTLAPARTGTPTGGAVAATSETDVHLIGTGSCSYLR